MKKQGENEYHSFQRAEKQFGANKFTEMRYRSRHKHRPMSYAFPGTSCAALRPGRFSSCSNGI